LVYYKPDLERIFWFEPFLRRMKIFAIRFVMEITVLLYDPLEQKASRVYNHKRCVVAVRFLNRDPKRLITECFSIHKAM
jgi:hypothetical protein